MRDMQRQLELNSGRLSTLCRRGTARLVKGRIVQRPDTVVRCCRRPVHAILRRYRLIARCHDEIIVAVGGLPIQHDLLDVHDASPQIHVHPVLTRDGGAVHVGGCLPPILDPILAWRILNEDARWTQIAAHVRRHDDVGQRSREARCGLWCMSQCALRRGGIGIGSCGRHSNVVHDKELDAQQPKGDQRRDAQHDDPKFLSS
mmetsp:Transcript_1016/g.2961  ORF Transcript_1016/g.2961 Transcript_1016/m.2961 type:complete len:202 (-) Transcript_1016:219-824(-)